MNSAAGYTGNLAAQFNDIGVQLASGQSPLLLAVQQGTQINQVLAQMGRGGGAVRALGRRVHVDHQSPMSLLTIGIIAGGAALVQWGIKAATAGRETRNLETAVEDAQDNLSNFSAAVDDASASLDTLEERFGTGAQAIRPFLQAVADLQQAITQTDVDAFGQALTRQFTGSGIGSMFRTLEGSLNQVFNLESLRQASGLMDDFGTGGAALEVLPARVQSLRSEFFGLIDAFEAAKGNLQEQDTILESMYFNVLALAEADEKRSKSENEILTAISQARLVTAETLAQKQQIAQTTETASEGRTAQPRMGNADTGAVAGADGRLPRP